AKKNVMGAEMSPMVSHHSESHMDETLASRKSDAIFRAAKKDLLTLMKLDVSGPGRRLALILPRARSLLSASFRQGVWVWRMVAAQGVLWVGAQA
ncbi:Patatin-like phospholipase domain-containing protein 7, partial [Saguinus oedipus]